MPAEPSRRPARPLTLPGTAGVVVAVLLATCAVVAAEAQWRQREHRDRDGHASSLVMGQFAACLARGDRGGEHADATDLEVRPRLPGASSRPMAGDEGFGGVHGGGVLRRVLNTPPPRA